MDMAYVSPITQDSPGKNHFNLLGLVALISHSTLLTTREGVQTMAWSRCSLNPASLLSCVSVLAAGGALWPSGLGRVEGAVSVGTGSEVGRQEPEFRSK